MASPAKHLDRYRDLIPDFAAFREALERPAPPHVRVNTIRTDPTAVTAALAALGVGARAEPWCSLMLRLDDAPSERRLGTSLLHALGHIYIQSGSSAVAALALSAAPGQRVLDLCAAPGSKTTFLAQQMENRGFLVANEASRKRLIPLEGNLRRMGVVHCIVTAYQGQNFPMRARFDRVLVDAPCSGEGTWRGEERAVPISEDARARLAERQAALLERGISVLAPGGELVYSTCTYAPEENERVVGPLMEKHGLKALPLNLDLGALPGLTAWEGRDLPPGLALAARLYPHRFDSEGFFVVRLAKLEG